MPPFVPSLCCNKIALFKIKIGDARKHNAKRKNPDGQINLPKSGFAFCCDFLTPLGKKTKKMAAGIFIFPRHSEMLFESETSEFCCEMNF